LRLGRLICLYDDNHISIDGPTELAFTEDRAARFAAYHWHVQQVDGNDRAAVAAAIRAAQAVTNRPSIICCRTHIGYGSPNRQDTAKAHGEPLGDEEVRLTKLNLGWPSEDPFYLPAEAVSRFRQAVPRGAQLEDEWQKMFAGYAAEYPELARLWQQVWSGELPADWDKALPAFKPADGAQATRVASGKVLNAIAGVLPTLIGGSADLTPSNNTELKSFPWMQAGDCSGRNIHFGVREHTMGAILNGMALHGGVIAYGGTFLVFSDYLRPAIRLAALMGLPVIYVFTHDSIGLGEDGPTHQPVEQLPALRAIPNLTVIRPADATETVEAWRHALTQRSGPVALLLSRQNLPVLDRQRLAPAARLARGAYVLAEADGSPEIILIGTGSEVSLAMEAAQRLAQQGIRARVVSMPSWELFERQPAEYREQVLPAAVTARLAVEAAIPLGWERYVGPQGATVGMHRFGASAPYQALMQHFGFSVENVTRQAMQLLGRE